MTKQFNYHPSLAEKMEYNARSCVSLSTTTIVLTILLAVYGSGGQLILAQQNVTETESSEKTEMSNMTNMSAVGHGGALPSMSIPGQKTFYIFTTEVENVDEEKLKVAGDSFSLHTLVMNNGDKVTVHYYNVDDIKTERHSFAQNGEATFSADHTGEFNYYCKYHLPVMTGQLVVLP